MDEATGKTMKRRGILAAAGAVVAGIAMKQTSQPVAAATVTLGTFNTEATTTTFYLPGPTAATVPAILGTADQGIGVQGTAYNSAGVYGNVPAASGASNTIAVQGINDSTGANGIGVYGQCAAVGGYGVLGATATPSSIGIAGMASADGSSAFSGGTSNPNAYAGYFQGHVVVAGSFDVAPLGNKHGVAPHPDGSHRTFYSVESPECWVEDFGTGTLVGGKAEVDLDADFALLAHTDAYHVFLTAHDADHHLAVPTRGGQSFSVQASASADAAAKGKRAAEMAGTFSYRVVARPKTTAKVDRLAKATLPTLPLPPMPKAILPPMPKAEVAAPPDTTPKKP
jgi:hypothetical protein